MVALSSLPLNPGVKTSGQDFKLSLISGMDLTTSVSYQWRRYPESITNDLISIYSNRNIFSAMLLAYIPITSQLNLNGFAMYDNDEDIDFDQQNNQSTIFTIELEYIF